MRASLAVILMSALALDAHAEPPAATEDEVKEEAPRAVQSQADLANAQGVRATLVGVLKRMKPEGIEGAAEGTAIVLPDGAAVFVSQGAPPDSWAWMVGSKVRVQGRLWSSDQSKGGWAVPWLADTEAPMPGDMGMPGL